MIHTLRETTKAIGMGISVAAISMVVFFIFAAVSILIPRDLIHSRIVQGFETGWVITKDRPNDYQRLGRDQYTDCLVFQMAMQDDDSFLEEWISPRKFLKSSPEEKLSPCTWLKEVAVDPDLDVARPKNRYHRYIHVK